MSDKLSDAEREAVVGFTKNLGNAITSLVMLIPSGGSVRSRQDVEVAFEDLGKSVVTLMEVTE